MQKPLPGWLPLRVIGPFLAYETVALLVLRYRLARGRSFPTLARYANALIETSLPTYILWWITRSRAWRSPSGPGRRCSISSSSSPRPCG